jgi:ubiquinone/menaquinone biosynthesis C-methylase UbiE
MRTDNQTIYDANWPAWVEMKVQGPASRWLRALIRSQLERVSGPGIIRSVLDVGCGEGTITHAVAEWLPQAQVFGIDFSKTGISCAETRYRRDNLRFVHDETSQMLSHRYDLVMAFEVLEHVENWPQFLGRIAGAAQEFVLLTFPTGRMRPFEKSIGHYRNFVPGEVEQFMTEHGFEARSIWYAGFPFYSPLYRDSCNFMHSANPSFVTGPYGLSKRILSSAIYFLFRFVSTKRRFGDQFCGLFVRKPGAAESLKKDADRPAAS